MEREGGGGAGGCDLRPMAEFLSDADCSRLLWMVIGELSCARADDDAAGCFGP